MGILFSTKTIMKEISKSSLLFYIFLCISILIGFYYGEDSSGGGSKLDYRTTFPLVENPFSFKSDLDIKFPLHYYIAFIVLSILKTDFLFRLFYVISSFSLPILFYKCLKIKFNYTNRNNLFLLSLILLLLPTVRTSAIWPNTHITGLFFFLISLNFFLRWEKKNIYSYLNKELIITLFMMALTVYTRQIYAIIYLYFVYVFFKKFNLKNFILICVLIFLLALPGIITVFFLPKILRATFDVNLQNSLLVNFSIIFLYLFPAYFVFYYKKLDRFKKDLKKNFILYLFFFTSILFLSIFFNYNYTNGGGAFMKVSLIFFENYYFFYFTSFLGIVLMHKLCDGQIDNIILSLLIIFGVSAYIIFHKYFEPMILILFFLVYKNPLGKEILNDNKKIIFYHVYFMSYLTLAVLNDIFNITLNI